MGCLQPTPPACGQVNPCQPFVCPDFQIKRHDTKPFFKVSVTDEDGDPMDLTGLVLEASMWANAKLKTDIDDFTSSLQFADNIGFDQILPDDIIVTSRVRAPEYMQVLSFDENNKTVMVERGISGTTPDIWKRGTPLKIFRFKGSPAATEMILEDVTEVDGTVKKDQLANSYFMYEWGPNDTCVPGCFDFEYKLLKMMPSISVIPSVIPSCTMGTGVEWVRRYPTCGEYLISICDSPTMEI